MATFTYGASIQPYQWVADWFQPAGTAAITTRTTTSFVWTNPDGTTTTLTGTGFTYDAGEPITGNITSIQVKQGATTLFSVTGLAASLQSTYFDVFGYDRGNGQFENGDGFSALNNLYALGDNTFNGSNSGDDIVSGYSINDDEVFGNGGDDFIKGDPGSDTIDGGSEWDTLSYEESHFNGRFATQGIILNVAAGTVTDCWGDLDTISNFEDYRGSRFGDIMSGTLGDDQFMGLRGADNFNGIGTPNQDFDTIRYDEDYRYGGTRGIVANWATGTVKDGWGSTDIMLNIEAVVGTKFNDRFTGALAGSESSMVGQDGVDVYLGGQGYDSIEFWDATEGVSVDMNLGLNEIQNDGHGNVENYSIVNGAIDAIWGGNFADTLIGDAGNNNLRGNNGVDTLTGNDGADNLRGGQGADILSGGAGADTFGYRNTNEGGDSISGFSSIDFFQFRGSAFGGLAIGTLAATRFQSRAADNFAQDADDRFIYRNDNDTLWFDPTGGNGTAAGAADAILIADIVANATVTAADILIN